VVKAPAYMVVEDVEVTTCNGCGTSVDQIVKYGVKYSDGSSVGAITICETPTVSSSTCSPPRGISYNACGTHNAATDAGGSFADEWSIGTDNASPASCGINVTDHWQWYQSAAYQFTFATLTGYAHTDAIQTNGYTVPPQSAAMPTNFRINP
jgi:hypothetical protein